MSAALCYADLLHTHLSGLSGDTHLGHVGGQFFVGAEEEENIAASAIRPEDCAALCIVGLNHRKRDRLYALVLIVLAKCCHSEEWRHPTVLFHLTTQRRIFIKNCGQPIPRR